MIGCWSITAKSSNTSLSASTSDRYGLPTRADCTAVMMAVSSCVANLSKSPSTLLFCKSCLITDSSCGLSTSICSLLFCAVISGTTCCLPSAVRIVGGAACDVSAVYCTGGATPVMATPSLVGWYTLPKLSNGACTRSGVTPPVTYSFDTWPSAFFLIDSVSIDSSGVPRSFKLCISTSAVKSASLPTKDCWYDTSSTFSPACFNSWPNASVL